MTRFTDGSDMILLFVCQKLVNLNLGAQLNALEILFASLLLLQHLK